MKCANARDRVTRHVANPGPRERQPLQTSEVKGSRKVSSAGSPVGEGTVRQGTGLDNLLSTGSEEPR